MRIFRTRIAQEDNELLDDSVKEFLSQAANPKSPDAHTPVSRSWDNSVYFKPGVHIIKCASYVGGDLKGAKETAARCHADAMELVEAFRSAGLAAECTADPDSAMFYSGYGGSMLIKCQVAVYYDGSPDIVRSTASKLGVKR